MGEQNQGHLDCVNMESLSKLCKRIIFFGLPQAIICHLSLHWPLFSPTERCKGFHGDFVP